jgi:hypothetical protein
MKIKVDCSDIQDTGRHHFQRVHFEIMSEQHFQRVRFEDLSGQLEAVYRQHFQKVNFQTCPNS